MDLDNVSWPELLGKVIMSTAVQASFGSLELPSRTTIAKFVTTQKDVDVFISSIRGYLFIGGLWTIGTTILMYTMHQHIGALINLIFQILIMIWIINRRYVMVRDIAEKNNFEMGSIF